MFQRNKKIITKKCKHSFSLLKNNIELRVSSTTITLENTEGTITWTVQRNWQHNTKTKKNQDILKSVIHFKRKQFISEILDGIFIFCDNFTSSNKRNNQRSKLLP